MFDMINAMRDASDDFKSRTEACNALQKFLELKRPDIQPGMYVERNSYGIDKYGFPREQQAAICIEKFEPRLEGGENAAGAFIDMLIAAALDKNTFGYFLVDSRFYKVANEKSNNIAFWRKK